MRCMQAMTYREFPPALHSKEDVWTHLPDTRTSDSNPMGGTIPFDQAATESMAYASVAASSTHITQRHVRLRNRANQADPSSPNGSTIGLSKLRPTKRFVSASMFEEGVKPEVGITRNTPVRSVETQSMRHRFVLETEHFKVPCPYVPDMWKAALHAANIHYLYPTLIQDITFGSPIGFNLLKLTFTFLLPNLPSALLQPEFICQELHAE